MTTSNNKMVPFYHKLQELGFSKKFIKAILPEWWDDKIADTEAGRIEAALMLSQLFSVDFHSLKDVDKKAKFQIPLTNFKANNNVDHAELGKAVALSTVAAKAALRSFDKPLKTANLTAFEIRKTLLERGNNWLDFRTLLEYTWEIGIPVLFLEFPRDTKKMQGLAISIHGHPVIILTSNKKYGYLVFDLAHELSHILAGHVTESNKIIIDEKIQADKSDNNRLDERELEANRIALEILTGDSETRLNSHCSDANILANASLSLGRSNHIDPAHAALNVAYASNQWALVSQALKIIKQRLKIKSTDPEICKEIMLERLNFEAMKELEHPMRVLTKTLYK